MSPLFKATSCSLYLCRPWSQRIAHKAPALARFLTTDHRNRLTNFFAPIGGVAPAVGGQENIHSMLLRAGYLRQAYAGIFHYLPLGFRVHEKLEKLIDKHMRTLGASKLALSTISSQNLWEESGRLKNAGAEIFKFSDRKSVRYILSPTHEEEITRLVSSLVTSYKQLPLRVYQVTRKYRDERRPRAGLLRGKEFTMKDLYTFDSTEVSAFETYEDVCAAYKALLNELKLPYIVAEADSGNMGGSLSHEYHYPSVSGEDTIISCTECGYTSNGEVADSRLPVTSASLIDPSETAVYHGITANRKTLVNVFYPRSASVGGGKSANDINLYRLKRIVKDLDSSVDNPLELFYENFTPLPPVSKAEGNSAAVAPYSQVTNLFDCRLPHSITESSFSNHSDTPLKLAKEFIADKRIPTTTITKEPDNTPLNLMKIKDDDGCPRCETGTLKITPAVELGHSFHLGTRYTALLGGTVSGNKDGEKMPIQMGCHGIGLSRMISAVAEGYRDERGLGWPAVIAPFEVAIVCKGGLEEDANNVYDIIASRNPGTADVDCEQMDVMLDDRQKDLIWKLRDADLIGYPVICVLGKNWVNDKKIEVQARRKGIKVHVGLEELRGFVSGLLKEL